MSKSLVLKPRLSEKAYELSQALRTYVFEVPKNSNKLSVKKAVEDQYEVGVTNVRVATIRGKSQRSFRGRGKFVTGKRTDIKKAYITLKEGDSLPLFAGVTEAPEDDGQESKS